MPSIDLSILNQRQTPAFYADTLANRPAFGFLGRIFVSTDTLDLYRDTGSAWVLLSPSSTGTVTGTGATGQVTYWASAGSITGTNNLFYDAGNSRLGINTNAPTSPLDVHSSLSGALMQLNQTSGILDSQLAFQSANVGKWRIGSYYNAGQYSFGIYDVFNSRERFSVLNTGQTFVGDQVSSSGRLVINSGSLGDNGLVVISSSSPSIRINNAGSGANFRVGLGISTATNNFIQGSADGDFCIFNGNTGTYPILFGINDTGLGNIQEAVRISAARNFLIGTTTDAGQKLQVNGNSQFTGFSLFNRGTLAFTLNPSYANANVYTQLQSTGDLALASGGDFNRLYITSAGNFGFGTSTPNAYTNYTTLTINGINGGELDFESNNVLIASMYSSSSQFVIETATSSPMILKTNFIEAARISSSQNFLIGTTTDAGQKLQVNGTARITGNTTIGAATAATNLEFNLNGVSGKALRIQFQNNGTNQWLLGAGAASETSAFELFNASGTIVISVDKTTNVTTINAPIAIGNSVSAAVAAPSTHKVSILINGVQYYLLASNV